MTRKYFGTDGMRGRVGQEPITPELVMTMGDEAGSEESLTCARSVHLGNARRREDAGGRYIEFCKSTFPTRLDLKGMRIVIDSAHGAGYQVAPCVFHELGADVISTGASPDGF